ncbi:hypothetical protein [Parasphingopyxis lamellibrachiae]|uniref:UrcA family protein n=1 Tax=Parasphingopyxis lamellibrachiae TaxID=680125 RepID=A0A3D9FHG9_9SPHN|nr:hypothetical protein [Parasphingopyxis lamellibrachiae]RED17027.1 hypothetical protein DFR46_2061 [Parasphingopyxis lamellibrachiae]
MNDPSRLCPDSRKYPLRLATCAASLTLLFASGAAGAVPENDSVRGASSLARASATIASPVSVRAVELENMDMEFGRAPGLAVAPAAVTRRDCADDSLQQRCALIILDLP